MTTQPTIYFDLDGTVYDLYGQPDWLERITTLADPTAYATDDLLVDRERLHEILDALTAQGWKVGVVTWLALGASREYDAAVRRVKRGWIRKHLPQVSEVHIVKYGTPKHRIVRNRADAILVDDNAEVRDSWTRGITIDASREGWLDDLAALIKE